MTGTSAASKRRAALEDFEDLVTQRSNKPMVYTLRLRKTDSPATRRALAQATAQLDSACLLADRACDLALHAAANPDHVLDNETRAKIRLYGVHVMYEAMHLGTIQDTYGRVRLNQPTDHWLL